MGGGTWHRFWETNFFGHQDKNRVIQTSSLFRWGVPPGGPPPVQRPSPALMSNRAADALTKAAWTEWQFTPLNASETHVRLTGRVWVALQYTAGVCGGGGQNGGV